MKHGVYKVLMYIMAMIVLTLCSPFFVLYGLGHSMAAFSKVAMDSLSFNPISKIIIRKVEETAPVEPTEETADGI